MKKMKELEKLYNQAEVACEVNNILIESSMSAVEKSDDKEERSEEVKLLKKELETKDMLEGVKRDFKERKAWREGYTVATVGTVISIFIGEFIAPKIVGVLLKKN